MVVEVLDVIENVVFVLSFYFIFVFKEPG